MPCLHSLWVWRDMSAKKKKGHLCSGCETIWEGEWNRGKARDHFHKVACVRLPYQAKRNITSIALIKGQTKMMKKQWRESNCITQDRIGKMWVHPIIPPCKLSHGTLLSLFPSIHRWTPQNPLEKKYTLPVTVLFQSNCTERQRVYLSSLTIKIMWCEMTETSLPF